MAEFGIGDERLYGNEIIPGDDWLMMVALSILRAVLPVLDGFVIQVIGCPGLMGEHLSTVAFILKHLEH